MKRTLAACGVTAAILMGSVSTATTASAATTYSCSTHARQGVGASGRLYYQYYSGDNRYFYYFGSTYVPQSGAFSYAAVDAQCILRDLGYSLVPDGIYGSMTQAAVADFQRKHDLTPDGFLGPATWPKLRFHGYIGYP
ncbi:putative peptidoglycan binding protein [Streptomyces sp. KS 21]|nr:putative peptidoglycan binding protein [Streptomyces sp. KS 21]